MIWVTARQSRMEALIVGILLALMAGALVVTGLEMTDAYQTMGLHDCIVSDGTFSSCGTIVGLFQDRFGRLESLSNWLNFLPLLLGLMLAAPAVADLEHGTYRLVWTQSISRRHWLFVRIGFGIAVATIISGGLMLLWRWWHGPFDALHGRLSDGAFNFEGPVLIAYTVFAFALCLTVGTLLRRIVPAAGISIVLFLVARLGIENWLRPHYRTPVTVTWDPLQGSPAESLTGLGSGVWILSEGFVNASGKSVFFGDPAWESCLGGGPRVEGMVRVQVGTQDVVNQCLHDNGILNTLVYQPANRFWAFQGIETAIFLAISLLLFALTTWWVCRRIV